tara:strand:+ start:1571 stop:1846 length:276 start_codon:yes stop_codon:yes gene_type:complete
MKLKYIKMDNKIYVGGGTEKFDGNLVSVSVCLSDLPSEHIQTGKNGKKYINLNVQKKKEIDQFGKTHYVAVDTWKPEAKKEVVNSNDDLPF